MWSLTFSTYCHLMYWNSITLSWTTLTNCSLIHEGFWGRRGMHSWGCIWAMIWHGCMSFHWLTSCQQYVCMCGVRSDFTLLCDYWMIYGDNDPIGEMTYCHQSKIEAKKITWFHSRLNFLATSSEALNSRLSLQHCASMNRSNPFLIWISLSFRICK